MKKEGVILFLSVVVFLVLAGLVSATNCVPLTTQSTCEASTDCQWHQDPWGSWCEQKGCWNYFGQTSCDQSNNASNSYYINKSCSWHTTTNSWCMEIGCWSLSGTNQSACVDNSYGIKCTWTATYNENARAFPCMGSPEKRCWEQQNSSACTAIAGCNWGSCEEVSCWQQTVASNCLSATGYNGNACKWNSQYNYCYESGCWDYSDITTCQAHNCIWNGGSCYQPSCYDYGYKNESYCVNNTMGLNCQWNNPWCEEKGCWRYNTANSCAVANASTGRPCHWETTTGGWCNEVGCWNWDSMNNGYEAACRGNDTLYNLNCTWGNNTATANVTDGWCYQDVTTKTCSSLNVARDCIDTFYCFWNSTSSICQEPSGNTVTEFMPMYPGCFLFDFVGQSACQNVTGCLWNAGTIDNPCRGNATVNSTTPSVGGVRCSYINNSDMCNSMSMLPSCCEWQGGSCVENKLTSRCWEQKKEPPEGAAYCEDYNSFTDKTLCETISGDPWYMPCKWDNKSTTGETDDRCLVKSDQLFRAGKESVIYLDNKQSCESAGGKWLTDTYCSTNDPTTAVAIPQGRCEQKFGSERNCNKECYACDYKSDGTNWSSAQKAKDACVGSVLGICKFFNDTIAPNHLGYCKAKDEFKKGLASDCESDCSSCTFMGDPTAAEPNKRPSSFCKNSKVQGGCKWIPNMDSPNDESQGRCTPKAEKTCEDKCDLCFDQNNCANKGGKKGNVSMSLQCSWNSNTFTCAPLSGSDQMEICWDGMDNNNNGKMDCADSMCWSDPFCGGNFMAGFGGKDCFGFNTLLDCQSGGCVWISENWGSWCDMPGSNCWKNDGNQTSCQLNGNCTWHSGFGGFCEENWTMSNNCMNLNQSTCSVNIGSGCIWVVDQFSQQFSDGNMGWCDPNWNYSGSWYDCVPYDTSGQTACENAGTTDSFGYKPCRWFTSGGGNNAGGWCDHMKFACAQFNISSTCTDASNATYNHSLYCTWNQNEWGAFCEGKTMVGGGASSCFMNPNQTACSAAGCNWKSGFCDPANFGSDMGFGGTAGSSAGAMGGSGSTCFQYDGNQTGCEAQQGCGWFVQNNAFCDVSFATSCPQYSYNKTICNAQSRCTFNSIGPSGGVCDEKPLSCFWNTTLNQNKLSCEGSPLCYWTNWNTCEPICFNASSSINMCGKMNATNGSFSVAACNWKTGLCNPGSSAQFFKGMEGGAPIPLGQDVRGDASPPEIDIIDFGLKDMGMGKAFGFGIRVDNVANSSMCNGIKLFGGSTGKGQNTSRFYWYLDTDGVRAGGCTTNDASALAGFEFYFKDVWSWSNTSGSAGEITEAYQCSSGNWKKAPIPLSSLKQVACTEIGGGMIAIEKAELKKFPDLYDESKDIRVYVATANNTGNVSNPTDTATPGWATPGAFDQDIGGFDMSKYKSNVTKKISDAGAQGYIQYADVDCWTQTGCADYKCQGHSYCVEHGYGISATGFTDSRVPKIIGVVKETYPDAALITFFTDKPANGSLELYGADSSCSSTGLTDTYIDIGINNSNIRDYRLWHVIDLNNTIHAPLASGVTYYYKLKFCDNESKCGVSKCSEFKTESSPSDCTFCKFVTRIDVPSGWNVSYDLNQDRVYEHLQGTICGANAGMKTNYTTGRHANIKLVETDNSSSIEFLNIRLTKTGLGSSIRKVSDEGAINASTTTDADGNTIGYAGMIEETRDKIIYNLYPEICLIKIPSAGTCNELWHCNSGLTKCVNRTAEAILNVTGSNYCIWQIPNCEFSSWAGGQPGTPDSGSSSTSSSSSGSSSGGSGGQTGQFAQSTWDIINAGEKKVMTIEKSDSLAITEIEFSVSERALGAWLKVTKKDSLPEEVQKFDKKVYKYLEITKGLTLKDGALSNNKIKFKVLNSWLNENAISKDNVALFRYNGGQWNTLSTIMGDDDGNYTSYGADTPGFSYFIIGQKNAELVSPTAKETPEVQGGVISENVSAAGKVEGKSFKDFAWLWVAIVLILVAAIVGIYQYYPKRK